MKNKFLLVSILLTIIISCQVKQESDSTEGYVWVPEIDGEWWQVAGNPDLGSYTSDKQEPVDFGVWQAEDGTWQLWSCIRFTNCGGNSRLFYGWEGKNLTDTNWEPLGITMEADTSLGEASGGLQAPHVIVKDDTYYMLYGGWDVICLAKSADGKKFNRVINESGTTIVFDGPHIGARDAMTLKIDDTYYTYYTSHMLSSDTSKIKAAVYCRTTRDFMEWSDPVMVLGGGSVAELDGWGGGDAECPFIVAIEDQYIMFRNQIYGQNSLNTQYNSVDPLNFGIDTDKYMIQQLSVAAPEIIKVDDQYYMAALNLTLDGIRIAKLKWVKKNRTDKMN